MYVGLNLNTGTTSDAHSPLYTHIRNPSSAYYIPPKMKAFEIIKGQLAGGKS